MGKFLTIMAIGLAVFIAPGVQAVTVSKWSNNAIDGPEWGRYLDDSVDANDFATNENSPYRPSENSDTPFSYIGNNSMEFDGANSTAWIDGGINGTTLELRTTLTIEAWIKPTDLSNDGGKSWQYIVGSGLNYGLIFDDVAQKFQFVYYQVTSTKFADFSSGVATLGDGEWHHIAATLDTASQEIKLYVDGNLDSATSTYNTTILSYTSYNFYMGGDGNGGGQGRNFAGLIDEVRISDSVLTAGELGYHQGQTSLPFDESFENAGANAGTLGSLNGQHGWSAYPGADVQDSVAYSGSQALQLENATVEHPFEESASATNVQTTFRARLQPGTAPVSIPTTASALFYVATNLHLVAYSNTVPVELATVVDTNAWAKFTVTCDYGAQTWSLGVDGTLALDGFPFYSAQPAFNSLSIINEGSGNHYSYVDEIAMAGKDASTLDIDGDDIPDWWETQYYGGAANADPAATASNGVNTVLEAYIAGFDPTNSLAGFFITGFSADAGLGDYILQWSEATGRVYTIEWASNLVDGFSLFETNYTGGAFTDTVHDAYSEGFYRLEVEITP